MGQLERYDRWRLYVVAHNVNVYNAHRTYSHSRQKYSEDDYKIVEQGGHMRNYLDTRLNST